MSDDLISRKALLKQFVVSNSGRRIPEYDIDNFAITIPIKDVKDIIRKSPTAFSKKNVIEELENLKAQYFITIANAGDERLDFAYKYVWNALNHAIEIVEKGGIE